MADEVDREGAHLIDDCCDVDDPLLPHTATPAVFDDDDGDDDDDGGGGSAEDDDDDEGDCLVEADVGA